MRFTYENVVSVRKLQIHDQNKCSARLEIETNYDHQKRFHDYANDNYLRRTGSGAYDIYV